jgi:hypothetical protein
MDTAKAFFYHAHGSALGGVIRWPIKQAIDSVAAISLPITGGHGKANEPAFNLQDIVIHKGASGSVSGAWNDTSKAHETEVTSTLEGLNVNNVVTAGRVVARLFSKHKPEDPEGSIVADGSEFVDLRISGHPVEVELDTALFAEHDTFAKFKLKHNQDADFRKMARQRFLWGDIDKNAPDWLKQRYKWLTSPESLPESKGIVPCSLVKAIKCSCPGVQIFGNVIIVPDFGKIFLGEVLLQENSRRLTMMRLEMGSPVGGSLEVGGIQGNGTTYP